jgi:hypothetical protein
VSGASVLTDDEDAASMGETPGDAPGADGAPAAPVAAGPAPITTTPTTSPGLRTVPATGTGGLY